MGEVFTRHSLRPLRFLRAKLFAALGRERVAGSRSCVHLKRIGRVGRSTLSGLLPRPASAFARKVGFGGQERGEVQ